MTTIFRYSTVAIVLFALGATARAQTAPPPGTGALELRIQSSSGLGGAGSLFGLGAGPGLSYVTETEGLNVSLSGGVGYFISPTFAIGGDVGITVIDLGEESLRLISLAPFVKYVTNLPARASGFFVETGLGYTNLDAGGEDSLDLLQVGAWAGGHFFIGQSSTAFLIGPYINYLRILNDVGENDADTFVFGLRFGISTYIF
jgi:hypothetical protein